MMSENEIIENQELQDGVENDVLKSTHVEEATSKKEAAENPDVPSEDDSVADVKKASDIVAKAKEPGTKAGIINAMFSKMNGMTKEQLKGLYQSTDMEYQVKSVKKEDVSVDYKADFSGDLNALVENEATLSEEFKEKAAIVFEAAIKSKLSEEIDRLEEKYNEELSEEVATTKADLVEKVDNYLNYVVESWMKENTVAIHNGLRTEIAENFMNSLKDLFTESYISVPDSKVDLVDELSGTVSDLEEKLNTTTGQAIELASKLEGFQKDAVIREASKDLAETQVEKLKKLAEDIDFIDEATFTKKVSTLKGSYFSKTKNAESIIEEDTESDDEAVVENSDVMNSYLAAIKKTAPKHY
jgi:hypothetical protein